MLALNNYIFQRPLVLIYPIVDSSSQVHFDSARKNDRPVQLEQRSRRIFATLFDYDAPRNVT